MTSEGFFEENMNTKPFVKMAFQGFAGSGKTFTSARVAAGLHRYIKSDKPIVLFDTERAVQFLRPLFKKASIETLVKASRSLADLSKTIKLCEAGAGDILVIDSISHVWEDFLAAYQKDKKRNRLEFQDWGVIKPTWKKEFSEKLVESRVHIIFTGRAGYEYSNEIDPETNKRQIYKSGVKMKVEGETAYEPDILVFMERFEELLTDKKKVWREATVVKDRSAKIDGHSFKNPTFKNFLPAVAVIMADPAEFEANETPAETVIPSDDWSSANRRRAKEIILEEIDGEIKAKWPGTTKEEKAGKAGIIHRTFETRSWKKVEGLDQLALEDGLRRIREELGTAAPLLDDGDDLPDDFGATKPETDPDTGEVIPPERIFCMTCGKVPVLIAGENCPDCGPR